MFASRPFHAPYPPGSGYRLSDPAAVAFWLLLCAGLAHDLGTTLPMGRSCGGWSTGLLLAMHPGLVLGTLAGGLVEASLTAREEVREPLIRCTLAAATMAGLALGCAFACSGVTALGSAAALVVASGGAMRIAFAAALRRSGAQSRGDAM